MPQPSTGGKGQTAASVSPSLQHHVMGFNAWMQKPSGEDLGTGYICKSVKIFLQDRNMLESNCGWGIKLLKQMKISHWNVKEAYCANLSKNGTFYTKSLSTLIQACTTSAQSLRLIISIQTGLSYRKQICVGHDLNNPNYWDNFTKDSLVPQCPLSKM